LLSFSEGVNNNRSLDIPTNQRWKARSKFLPSCFGAH